MTKSRFLMIFVTLAAIASSAPAFAGSPFCFNNGVNLSGNGGAITVDATSGGVLVAAQTLNRCALSICNSQTIGSGNDMRCCPTSGTQTCVPTSSIGTLIQAGFCRNYGTEGVQSWKCIRTTSGSATAEVNEALP